MTGAHPGVVIAGKYTLKERLSTPTGQGDVFRAERVGGGADVAIKLMQPDDPEKAKRTFELERKTLSRIKKSAHVAEYIDGGFSDGYHYIVTRLIPGRNLQAHMSGRRGLPDELLRKAAVGSLRGLQACHAVDVVHRDVKPANLVLDDVTGDVVLVDFGVSVALMATTMDTPGSTPMFASPEYSARKPDTRSDIFSWGSTMVYLSTGHFAFGADEAVAGVRMELVMSRILEEKRATPDMSGVPATMAAHISAALSWDLGQRPTATELLRRLARTDPLSTEVMDDRTVVYPPSLIPRWARTLAGMPYLLFGAALIGLFTYWLLPGPPAWAALLSATVAGLACVVGLNPPRFVPSVADQWKRYWARWRPADSTRAQIPAFEFLIAGAVTVWVIFDWIVHPLPDSPQAGRAVTILAILTGVILSQLVRSGRVARFPGHAARGVWIPLACVAVPIVCLQLRSLTVSHLAVVNRLLPWWSVFVVACVVALLGGFGGMAAASRKLFIGVTVGCAFVAALALAWLLAYEPEPTVRVWQAATQEVRSTTIALIVGAASGLVLALPVGHLPAWRRGTVCVCIPCAALLVMFACWWSGWVHVFDAWVTFHLPPSVTPWDPARYLTFP